jgi:hypothetical protein
MISINHTRSKTNLAERGCPTDKVVNVAHPYLHVMSNVYDSISHQKFDHCVLAIIICKAFRNRYLCLPSFLLYSSQSSLFKSGSLPLFGSPPNNVSLRSSFTARFIRSIIPVFTLFLLIDSLARSIRSAHLLNNFTVLWNDM